MLLEKVFQYFSLNLHLKNVFSMENQEQKQNNGLKYAGLGTQLLITIGAGVYIGLKIDAYMQNKQPWAAIISALTFMAAGLYLFIKSLPKL